MQSARDLLNNHIELLKKTLVTFSIDEKEAISLLETAKKKLSEKNEISENEAELYTPAVYNALAVINSAPQQKQKNRQLIEAITDAKEELKIISEML